MLEKYTKVQTKNGKPTGLKSPRFKEVPKTDISKKLGDRENSIGNLKAMYSGIEIDANEVSMDRLDRVLSVSTALMLLEQFPDNLMWDDMKFPWVDANNKPIEISLLEAVKLQEDGLTKLSALWGFSK